MVVAAIAEAMLLWEKFASRGSWICMNRPSEGIVVDLLGTESKNSTVQQQDLQTSQRAEESKPSSFCSFLFLGQFCWLQITTKIEASGFWFLLSWLLVVPSFLADSPRVCKLILHKSKIFSKAA